MRPSSGHRLADWARFGMRKRDFKRASAWLRRVALGERVPMLVACGRGAPQLGRLAAQWIADIGHGVVILEPDQRLPPEPTHLTVLVGDNLELDRRPIIAAAGGNVLLASDEYFGQYDVRVRLPRDLAIDLAARLEE